MLRNNIIFILIQEELSLISDLKEKIPPLYYSDLHSSWCLRHVIMQTKVNFRYLHHQHNDKW
jgi:hypothetical protein